MQKKQERYSLPYRTTGCRFLPQAYRPTASRLLKLSVYNSTSTFPVTYNLNGKC